LIRAEFAQSPAMERVPRMQALAKQIVDAVIARGECDFVSEVAGEMPSYVIAELMGLPLDDGRELYKLTEIIHTSPEALPPNAGAEAVLKMFQYGRGVIDEKRARPADDLATKLLQAEVDGKRLDDTELLSARMAEGRSAEPAGRRARRAAAVDLARHLYAAHRKARYRTGQRDDPRRPEGRNVFRVCQSRCR
jgi:hypothetical protein